MELLNDLCWRLAPLSHREAANMVRDFRSAPLLTGYRGRPPVDIRSHEDLLLRLSQLMETGEYFRDLGVPLPDPAFLEIVVVEFGIADAASHYHVPLMVSPYGYSTYRGS